MSRSHLLKWWNIIAFIAVIVVNILASTLPIGGRSTAAVSNMYPTLLTPAGYAFSIWSVIYLLLACFVVYQATSAGQTKTSVQSIGVFFILSCIFNMIWIFFVAVCICRVVCDCHYTVLALSGCRICAHSYAATNPRGNVVRQAAVQSESWLDIRRYHHQHHGGTEKERVERLGAQRYYLGDHHPGHWHRACYHGQLPIS
nr:TspO/MBR family protein [Paenibacillus sp. RC343]